MGFDLERSAAALEQICHEDPQTILCVTARLNKLSPDGSDDDVCLVCHSASGRT